MNLNNLEDRPFAPYNKKSCPCVSLFLSVAYFSATAQLIFTKFGMNLSTVSGFINPKNQHDWLHFLDSLIIMKRKLFKGFSNVSEQPLD